MLNCRKTCMESQLIEQSQSVCWDSNHDRKHPNESGKLRLWPLACLVTLLRMNKATHVCNTISIWRGQDFIFLFLKKILFFYISFSIDLLLWRLGRKETWMNWTCGFVVMLYLSLTVRKGWILNISIPMLCSEHTALPKGGSSWKPSQCFSWTGVRRIVRRAFKECDSSVLRGRTSSNEEGKFGRERESRIGCLCSRSWSRRLGAVKPFPRTAAVLIV